MNTPYRFNTIKTARLGDQISSELIRAITDGHYKVGDMLPSEIELARIFGRSRISVRDALKRLSSLGIITTRQGQGTVVNPTAMWNTLDPELFVILNGAAAFDQLLEMRRIIEPESAYLAAQRITDPEVENLRTISHLSIDDTVEQHVERDTRFHLEIARAARNGVLLTMMSSISLLLSESRSCTYAVPGEITNGHAWHQAILAAIEQRDADSARTAMLGHLEQVGQALRRWQEEHAK